MRRDHRLESEVTKNYLKNTSKPAQAIIRTVSDTSAESNISTISFSGPSTKHNRHILSASIGALALFILSHLFLALERLVVYRF